MENENYLDNMNSYDLNQNSNSCYLTLSKPSSSDPNQGIFELMKQLNFPNDIDNNPTKDISNNNNDFNKDGKNLNNENVNIFNNIHPEIKFISKKKGRPRKGQENQSNRNHTNVSYDNARKKIINSCKKNIYNLIIKNIPKNSNITLHMPTIEKQMGYSYESINKFFDKKIYDIFCDSKPKKLKNEIKNNPEQYQHNTKNINKLLEDELKDENKQIKILYGLFNLYFKDYLVAYLNDEKEIKILDDINISLNGFKTYCDCFTKIYDQNQKNSYKTKILKMFDNK